MIDNRGVLAWSGVAGSASQGRRGTGVVLADDDVLLREGLASLLDRSGFEVLGQAGNGTELLALVRSARPELAIIGDALRSLHADGKLPPGIDPDDLATTLLATLQGGLLLAQVQRSTRPFETAVDTLLALAIGR